ncbi:hypothetical protein G9A89_000433, partial [Geosiphon pyriformis]
GITKCGGDRELRKRNTEGNSTRQENRPNKKVSQCLANRKAVPTHEDDSVIDSSVQSIYPENFTKGRGVNGIRKRTLDGTELVSSIRELSKISTTEINVIKELNLRRRIEQLRDDKRRLRQKFNELKVLGEPSDLQTLHYKEELADVNGERQDINLELLLIVPK